MIERKNVLYLNSIINLAEENGFTEYLTNLYTKKLDIAKKRKLGISIKTSSLSISFRSRKFSIYFETYYQPFNKRNAHIEQISEIINTYDVHDIFNLISDYCEEKNIYQSILFDQYGDHYIDKYFLESVSSFFVIKESNAYLFFASINDYDIINKHLEELI